MSKDFEFYNADEAKPNLSFWHENANGEQETIAKFWFDKEDMTMKFKGNVDEAGKIFIDFVIKGLNEQLQALVKTETIDIVFSGGGDGSGPGEFVEVEDQNGSGISVGDWIEREDGYTVLRIRHESFN